MICQNCGCALEPNSKFCTHCGKETSLNNQENLGRITISRIKKTFGCTLNFSIYVDNVKINSLTNGGTINLDVPLGKHNVKIETFEKAEIVDVELTEQKRNVTIITTLKMGLLVGRPSIQEVKYN